MFAFPHQFTAPCHHASMPPQFRLAAEEDSPRLLALIREFHREEGIAPPAGAVEAAVRQLIGRAPGRIWLIGGGDGGETEPAGYFVLTFGFSIEFEGRDAFLDELFLRPEFRGRGWGTAAVEFAASAARELGVRALHLEAARGNERAIGLYRRLGFREHDRFLMTKWLAR